jgi:hypothetical protein
MKRGNEVGTLGLIILCKSNVKVKFMCTPLKACGRVEV